MHVRGTLTLLPKMEWIPRCTDSIEGRISLQGLECRLIFHLTKEGMSESPVETLEKVLVPHFIWTGVLTSLDTCRVTWSSRLQKVTMPAFS